MILGRFNENIYKLSKNMTVDRFIKDVVEKDLDKELKYYCITLKKELSGRNMVLYYQYGILKSHHTSYSKMDYKDYLEYEIFDHYKSNYIEVDNVISYNENYRGDDCNKPKNVEIKPIDKKMQKEIIDNVFKELEIEDIRKEKLYKIKNRRNEELDLNDIIECVRQMIEDNLQKSTNEYIKEDRIKKLEDENKKLQARVKWLDYKMNLLLNKNTNNC
nr:hypothetical protein [Clostridium neonatale]DAW05981.1 MAG TPA: hypothetical protein [Caudoviricetes sp.]